jgi:hypothetical protein
VEDRYTLLRTLHSALRHARSQAKRIAAAQKVCVQASHSSKSSKCWGCCQSALIPDVRLCRSITSGTPG